MTEAEYAVRLAEGLCVTCGADDHLNRMCPNKSQFYFSGVHFRRCDAGKNKLKQADTPLQTVVGPSPPQLTRKVVQPEPTAAQDPLVPPGLPTPTVPPTQLPAAAHSADSTTTQPAPALSRGSLPTRLLANQTPLPPPSLNLTCLLLQALPPQTHLLAPLSNHVRLSWLRTKHAFPVLRRVTH